MDLCAAGQPHQVGLRLLLCVFWESSGDPALFMSDPILFRLLEGAGLSEQLIIIVIYHLWKASHPNVRE